MKSIRLKCILLVVSPALFVRLHVGGLAGYSMSAEPVNSMSGNRRARPSARVVPSTSVKDPV